MPHRLFRWLFLLLVIGPLTPVGFELFDRSPRSDFEWDRLAELLANTLLLGFLTLCLTLPPALLFAFRWFDLPPRWQNRVGAGLALALFVPLPFLASAWQASFEKSGIIQRALAGFGIESRDLWQPWKRGFATAATIHAHQLLPWVFLIFALYLKAVPKAVVEEMRLLEAGRATRWRLLLPQLRPAIMLAAAWCFLVTSTEIVVTDMALVRTLAEEVYTQSVVGVDLAREAVRSLAFAVPLALFLRRALRHVPRWPVGDASACTDAIAKRPALRPFAALGLILIAFPIIELARQFAARSESADAVLLWRSFALVWRTYWQSLLWSAFNAAVTGILCATLALGVLNYALERRRLATFIGLSAVIIACLPGPTLGFSAKAFFFALSGGEERLIGREGPLQFALYDGPAALPVIWVHVVKYWPLALALQYAALRTISPALRESARTEGVSDGWRLQHLSWPAARPAFALSVLAVTLLSFGEVSAGKIVETPGSVPFSQEIFNQMHSGVSTTVAAMSLIQIASLAAMYGMGLMVLRRTRGSDLGS